jgi:hypothetical protein
MKYIGNYSSWINDNWISKILETPGQARPRDWPPNSKIEQEEYQKYATSGYDLNAVNWWIYESKDLDITISPPWTTGKIHWWITKLTPGQFMPMHTDPHTHDVSCARYWVPLQDYHPGHVFVYKDEMITNYKKGDVYVYTSSTDLHGAANIGQIPRLVLQITEYDI